MARESDPAAAPPRRVERSDDRGEDVADDSRFPDADNDEGMTRLFVNVGRRDGVRAGELARFFRDEGDLPKDDIGRIRVRDKHSFVDVRTEQAARAVDTLVGKTLGDRELVVEIAKSDK